MRAWSLPLMLGVCLIPSIAYCGWFGPSDYRECVISEMKGSKIYMLNDVRQSCRDKFPCGSDEAESYDHVCQKTSCQAGYYVSMGKCVVEPTPEEKAANIAAYEKRKIECAERFNNDSVTQLLCVGGL